MLLLLKKIVTFISFCPALFHILHVTLFVPVCPRLYHCYICKITTFVYAPTKDRQKTKMAHINSVINKSIRLPQIIS